MSQICVLKRITTKDHQNCDKFNQIQLKNDFNQIYIGRDVDCNYRISSIEISRKHALLELSSDDHFWTISDLNSTNGLFVNSVQLQPYNPYRLVNGDKVSFGPPNQSQFCYQFVDNSVYDLSAIGLTAIPVIPIVTRYQTNSTTDSVLTTGLHIGIEANQSRTVSLTSTMPTRSGLNYTVSTTRVVKKEVPRKMSQSADRQTIAEHDYSRNSSAPDKNRKSASKKLKFKETEHKSSKLGERERKLFEKEREKLEKSKKSLEQQKHMDRQKIKRKEEALRKKQRTLERKERDAKKREEEIEKMRKQLEKERSLLEKNKTELKETEKGSKRKLRSTSVRDSTAQDSKRQCKEDQKKVIEDLLDSDLTCSICSEYFIQAVNLNCSHTFCEHCIEEWKRTNAEETVCPICRKTIENQNRELVLDNLIDQFIAQTKPILVEHRKKVAEERKKKMAKKVSHSQNTGSSARDRLTRLIPSLHFFLRSNTSANSSSDSETDDLSIINVNLDEFDSNSVTSWSSDSSDSDSDDSFDDSSSGDESVASSQNSVASVRSVRSDHNYIDIDISSLYSSHASNNGSNDSNFSDSDSDVESVVSIHSDDSNRINIDINSNDSSDSQDSDYSD